MLFNPPYYRGVPRDAIDHAWRSPDVIERFADQLADHLTPTAMPCWCCPRTASKRTFLAALDRAGFRSAVVAERDLINETLSVYHISPMLILYNPPSSARRKPVMPLSLLALGALLEGRHDYTIVDGNLDPHAAGDASIAWSATAPTCSA